MKSKVSQLYDVENYFIDKNLNKTSKEILKEINKKITEENINVCFFQGDYLSLINYDFIEKTLFKRKYIFLTDDFDAHEVNSYSVLACDGIMTSCPISKIKYKEKNLDVSFYNHEGDEKIFKNYNLKKDIDVFFYGVIKADRKKYIEYLKSKNVKIKIIVPGKEYLPYDEIAKYISRSKVVLNFSKTGFKNKFYSHKTYAFNYSQFKGRIFVAGHCGTLCISEYSPGQEVIFGNDIPTFKNEKEMFEILEEVLNDDVKLNYFTEKFVNKCNEYSNINHFPIVDKELSLSMNRKNVRKLPYWYLKIFIIKSIRLYAKNGNLLNLYKEYLEKILSSYIFTGFTYPILILETFLHLFFLQFGIIKKNFIKKGNEKI